MSGDLVPIEPTHITPSPSRGVTITTMDDLARFSAMVLRSGWAPKDFGTPERIGVAIQHGLELGLSPMQAIQSISVINGKPGIYGDAMIALVMGSGCLADIREIIEGTGDAMQATCTAWRKGIESPFIGTFSVEDAKRAQLWGRQGPWTQYPQRMLKMRARGFALRDGFADVLKGLKPVEELQDYPEQ